MIDYYNDLEERNNGLTTDQQTSLLMAQSQMREITKIVEILENEL